MSEYYTHGSYPSTGSTASSAGARAEFDAISAGFDKLPALAGNAGKLVIVNAGATALESSSAITISGSNVAFSGAVTGITDLTTTGNTTLGNAVGDTLSVGGSTVKNGTGNWTFAAPSSGVGVTALGVAGSPVLSVQTVNGTLERSLQAGSLISGTNFPRIEFKHTESIGLSRIDFTSSTGTRVAELAIGNTTFLTASSAGNVTIAAPSSGLAALTVNGTAATQEPVKLSTTVARGSGQVYLPFYDPTGLKGYLGYANADDSMSLVNSTNAGLRFFTNNTERAVIAANGNVTIAAPSSGTALTVDGASGGTAISGVGAGNGFALLAQAAAASSAYIGWNLAASAYQYTSRVDVSTNSWVLRDAIRGTDILTIAQNGATTLASSTSGTTLTINSTQPNGLTVTTGTAGFVNTIAITSGDNTSAASQNSLFMQVGGASAGDNFIRMNILAVQDWSFGVDNSDSDRFKFGSDAALGSSTKLAIHPTTGAMTFNSDTAVGIGSGSDTFAFAGSTIGFNGSQFNVNPAANFEMVHRAAFGWDFYTNSASNLSIKFHTDGRLSGRFLHNVGTVTGTTDQFIASGTYTPTLTNTTNITASTASACQWIRVGNVVTVSGKVSISGNTANLCVLGMTLPIASAISANEQLGGTGAVNGGSVAQHAASIEGDPTNDRATWNFLNAAAGAQTWFFTFSYVVL